MLRLARQRSRVFVQCTQLSRFITRQKHIPTANKTIITPTIATTKLNQGAIEIIDPETIVNLNELPFRLPVIRVGDYVEAFRYLPTF